MEVALMQLQSKDTKERIAGVEKLQVALEQCRKSLSGAEVSYLVDTTLPLFKDNNFRVAQGALQALASAAPLAGDHLKLHFNALLPAAVERLGDSKQPVRDAGRRLLLALMEVSSPAYTVERAGAFAWGHRNWRVREEFARTTASALNLFSVVELPFHRHILPSVLHLLEDSSSNVRESAMLCLEEMYRQGGQQFREELQLHHLRTSQLKEMSARFEKIEPTNRCAFQDTTKHVLSSGSGIHSMASPNRLSAASNQHCKQFAASDSNHHWPASALGNYSPKWKPCAQGETATIENSILAKPIRVFSERELAKEFEKAKTMLIPSQDWSVRMSAMQRIEGIVAGGATKLNGFLHLLKQLVNPLCDQLADRRSSVVKQACQLLKVLAMDLNLEFEVLAESFLPVLFNLVVITVLVIAESAHACIKLILQHCRVPRVLPKMVELAKHDRKAVLRARCCEYLLLVLEQWCDSPEMQRFAELYEDFIKCCCGDAVSEVRYSARQCYPAFTRCWPDRARRLFQALDHATQKVINDEDGGIPKNYGYFAAYDAGSAQLQGHHATGLAALAGLANGDGSLLNGHHHPLSASRPSPTLLPRQSTPGGSDWSCDSGHLHAIDAIPKPAVDARRSDPLPAVGEDSYLKIHSIGASGPARPGADIPTSRETRQQCAAGAYHQPSPPAQQAGSGDQAIGDLEAARAIDWATNTDRAAELAEGAGDQVEHPSAHSSSHGDADQAKRVLHRAGSAPSQDGSGSSRVSTSSEEALALAHTSGVATLSDALEGLAPGSDWSARVAALAVLRRVVRGSRGLQEVAQSFDRVMRLLAEHVEDAHHKVAQAALAAVAELVPACRRLFEAHLERILPRVFARLVDAKEGVRRLSAAALEAVGNTFSVGAVLPALMRALDEQRSPKAKVAVMEYASAAFARLALSGDGGGGGGGGGGALLKLWLAKLAPLVQHRNARVKGAAVAGVVSAYSHFDSAIVVNFVLGLAVEEQGALRRALRPFSRIEADLAIHLHSRGRRSSSRLGLSASVLAEKDENYCLDHSSADLVDLRSVDAHCREGLSEVASSGNLCFNGLQANTQNRVENDYYPYCKMGSKCPGPESGTFDNNNFHMLSWDSGQEISTKESTLQQIMEFSRQNDSHVWSKHYNQIITLVLEALDDPEPSIKELAASALLDMLENQKVLLEKDIEVLLEKLLQLTKDNDHKVNVAGDSCLNVILTELDPYRCLSVIVPLLQSENEKALMTYITCLAKIVSRLPPEDLVSQLNSFLPMLFEAFGNQDAAVRKTVVFCLVEIYIVLGKDFVPYLGSLNSTQLRLVTIYANRISQARTGLTTTPRLTSKP